MTQQPLSPSAATPHLRPLGADFARRHIGLSEYHHATMLAEVGYATLDELVDAAVPKGVRNATALNLPAAASEAEVLAELRSLAALNAPGESMIGLGYQSTITPSVIRRNVLESPAWYTAYTPYQPEISQGRLEGLLNFQTMVGDLTGLPTANASLLEEGTAVAEAVTVMRRAVSGRAATVLLDADCLPQTIAVVQTRCAAIGVEVLIAGLTQGVPECDFFGIVVQYPAASGAVRDHAGLVRQVRDRGAMVTVAADLLALTVLTPPGEWGADVAVGSTQRFGVPLGYGGPHAGYIAVRAGLERSLPGRLIGVSVDATGEPAYRLALQTREQHIRRDKATSNICTAQALLAIVASMYAAHHGPNGLAAIARSVHAKAQALRQSLRSGGVEVVHDSFFDTVLARVPGQAATVVKTAGGAGIHLRLVDPDHVGISCGETTTTTHLNEVLAAFGLEAEIGWEGPDEGCSWPSRLVRASDFLTHPVFTTHRSETAMLRYPRRLSDRDYALDRGMISLGSCTMKLNATTEMEPISFAGFADLHPFAPAEAGAGYARLIGQLEQWLAEVTGYAQVSIQPNAGSQGEFAGLLAIRAYHRSRDEAGRDVCLIPSSAHGTNAASAALAGMRVVVVAALADGTVDLDDLRAKCQQYSSELAAIMLTYPSTHGVYEERITELCEIVHSHGGQVYVDGANLNALLGLAAPGRFGGDVSHLNLHKTFCIPHGGGGPGVGPVAVAAHLAPFLPTHPLHPDPSRRDGIGQRRAVRQRGHPADHLGICPADVRRRSGRGDEGGGAVSKLRRVEAGATLSYFVHGQLWPGGARVHPRPEAADQGDRSDGR
jgi:glycine dehydrogenase